MRACGRERGGVGPLPCGNSLYIPHPDFFAIPPLVSCVTSSIYVNSKVFLYFLSGFHSAGSTLPDVRIIACDFLCERVWTVL